MSEMTENQRCIAFEGHRRIASGSLLEVALKVKEVVERGEQAPILIFDEATSQLVDVDLRGTASDVAMRLAPQEAPEPVVENPPPGPGRPKLGVVAREVTLLPRHWEWLSRQPGGASVALRKLVDEARRASAESEKRRLAQEGCYRFMLAVGGNLPGYEEANRALFAGQQERFGELLADWPKDVRDHAMALAGRFFS